MNIFDRLRDYFQGIADAFADEKSASRIFPNAGDAGSSREDVFMNFLASHLPKRCEVIKGGFIFDASGNESRQIDLIITNDLTLQFKQFDSPQQRGKSFNCVEGCYCAISVKTTLDKKELIDSLESFACIPAMPVLRINPLLRNTQQLQDLPYCVIFAYTGIAFDTALGHIRDHYAANAVPHNRRPNLIIVNNRYAIIQTGPEGGTTRDGDRIPPYTFWPIGMKVEHIGGYSLLYLLTEIQKAANIGSQMLMDFAKYVDKIP